MSVVFVQRALHCSSQKKTLETVHIYTKGNHISIFQFIESFQQITLQFTAYFGFFYFQKSGINKQQCIDANLLINCLWGIFDTMSISWLKRREKHIRKYLNINPALHSESWDIPCANQAKWKISWNV